MNAMAPVLKARPIAHVTDITDPALIVPVDINRVLDDSNLRRQIADRWLSGWLSGGCAMAMLVSLDLIECNPDLAPHATARSRDG